MAETQAGQGNAQQEQGEQQRAAGDGAGEGEGEQEQQAAGRTYTQAELDRILGKVRKNARYLGRKEAEAELVARGATRQQAEQAVDRQQQEQPKAAPKRDDFENYEDYLDARADFRARNASREEREAQDKAARERRVSEERQHVDREFAKHAKAAIAKNPEIAEAIEAAEDVQMTETMGDAVKEAGEIGIYILHYLVEHPEEAARISALESKSAQTREIGKLEAKVEAERKAKVKAKPQGEEGEDEQEGEAREDESTDADGKGEGKDADRGDDGRFKAQEKGTRKAPDTIEPGTGRSANQDRGPTDKDSDSGWFAKRLAQEKAERSRQRGK